MWEQRPLRDITEAGLQQLVDSGVEEHLQLEYKSALYDGNDRGNKEFLLDICMFANAGGGILLIGIAERRDDQGQPTGSPDPNVEIGIGIPNPELTLQSYDARAVAAIEDRVPLESFAIPAANDRNVLAIRVPNSMATPHCVRYQGHVYFPSRRERQRYEMDIREIKEMVMRTASRLEEAEQRLGASFLEMPQQDDSPYLLIGSIPVFGRDFLLDVRNGTIIRAVGMFDLANQNFVQPTYNFNGLERQIVQTDNSTVQVRRNGLIVLNKRLAAARNAGGAQRFFPAAVDLTLRKFVTRTSEVYAAAGLNGPFLISMMLRARNALRSVYPGQVPGTEEEGGLVPPNDYRFPVMQADNLLDIDSVTRPLCDQAHQMFGRNASPLFDGDGVWIQQNR